MAEAIGWLWAAFCLAGGAIVLGRFITQARRPVSRQSWGKVLIYGGVILIDAAAGAALVSSYVASPSLLTALGIFLVVITSMISILSIGRTA